MHIKKERWGTFKAREVYLYTLTNSLGGVVQLTNYGARVVAIQVEDRAGTISDVALGFDTLTPYLEDDNYIGATMGRFANRISHAQFDIEAKTWKLEANEGIHCNHSGSAGFDHRVFNTQEPVKQTGKSGEIAFQLFDPHGKGGFPGDLNLTVTYVWEDRSNELHIHYQASTNQTGILNLTNHCYFNLSGNNAPGTPFQNCLYHHLQINAHNQLEMDDAYLPTGNRLPVNQACAGSQIRDQCTIEPNDSGASAGVQKGLNACYELMGHNQTYACRLRCDSSGRQLEILTSYPGLLVYTGDDLKSYAPGYFGRPYRGFDGVALECQYYPDSPNIPSFPPATIGPDKNYHEFITYRFSTYKT